MRAIIQRVTQASVSVQDKIVSEIGKGLMVLVGLTHDDTLSDMEYMQVSHNKINASANKIITLRLFSNHDHASPDTTLPFKPWSCSVKDAQLDILSVSQFTLFAQTHKGTKPDFHLAMKNPESQEKYTEFVTMLKLMYNGTYKTSKNGNTGQEECVNIKDGIFGAMMQIQLINDGPVTIILDSKDRK